VVADWIGMRGKPGFHHETACSSTNVGLRHAVVTVASGLHDIVLSGGVETTNSRPVKGKPAHIREAVSQAELWYECNYGADQAYWYHTGIALGVDEPSLFYAKKYGLTLKQMDETLAHAAINNRRNGVRNPLATFVHQEFPEEAREHGFNDVMEYMFSNFNPKLGLLMRPFYGPIVADGASALIVCPTEIARNFSDHPIEVIGIGSSTAVGYHNSEDIEKEAFAQAYQMAKINPYRDIDYMHVHDCMINTHFTATELGGYFRPGEAWCAIQEGRTTYDGDKPLSTTGGRNSMGHAWCASAGAEIAEAVRQMRGLCNDRQIKPVPEVSVVHNLGHGLHCNVSVLRTLS
jgi:acetyl-CoA C-acetyltransferase